MNFTVVRDESTIIGGALNLSAYADNHLPLPPHLCAAAKLSPTPAPALETTPEQPLVMACKYRLAASTPIAGARASAFFARERRAEEEEEALGPPRPSSSSSSSSSDAAASASVSSRTSVRRMRWARELCKKNGSRERGVGAVSDLVKKGSWTVG